MTDFQIEPSRISRFCITGLPRSRTAWLAGLLAAHGAETIHERPMFFQSLGELRTWLYAPGKVKGLVDAFAALTYPDFTIRHFSDQPLVLIHREPEDVRRSYEAWAGVRVPYYDQAIRNWEYFKDEARLHANPLHVQYKDLENEKVVSTLCDWCTGRELDHMTWLLFNKLKIEQHKMKAIDYMSYALGR